MNLNEAFFDGFFPCVIGHTKLIDKFHSNPNYPYYDAVKNERIKFYNENVEDPYCLVKMVCTTMIVLKQNKQLRVYGKGEGRMAEEVI